MAELMFGLGQTKKKKESEAKITQTKADTWKYKGGPDGGVESEIRKQQHNREKDEKNTRVQTKTNLRDVNMAVDTVESGVRKEQHNREKEWKETGKQTKGDNTNFDMARALFN
jgi:multidrug resistance efflux pump